MGRGAGRPGAQCLRAQGKGTVGRQGAGYSPRQHPCPHKTPERQVICSRHGVLCRAQELAVYQR